MTTTTEVHIEDLDGIEEPIHCPVGDVSSHLSAWFPHPADWADAQDAVVCMEGALMWGNAELASHLGRYLGLAVEVVTIPVPEYV